ncbi:MAG: U32 family peptidase [Deltaproteobacteria bacterium]|nr:U32 family peptidase [Deltaproteobacteria bacterium]
MKSIELLAPAGNMEKLKTAIHYGADAVYLSGKRFGLRAAAGNFDTHELREAVRYAREKGVRLYVTVNIFFHNQDLEGLEEYLLFLNKIEVHAVIISDPGVLALARKLIPEMEVHLSTQANTTNWRSVAFWKDQGVSRINMARELSLGEIKEVREKTGIEVEAFVHGAVCMAYSGRCHLSSHMTGRDANYGECTHSCRWEYSITESKRPDQEFDVEEDERGTYFFNSKDICMIEHIPALIESGIHSLKIEGRVKGINYVAGAVRSYRLAMDAYLRDPGNYKTEDAWLHELRKLSHRDYDTGFYFGEEMSAVSSQSYVRRYDFVGVIKENLHDGNYLVEARNKIQSGDTIEIMGRGERINAFSLSSMKSPEGHEIPHAQPKQLFIIKAALQMEPMDILRREKG